jgi:hypothetical protein
MSNISKLHGLNNQHEKDNNKQMHDHVHQTMISDDIDLVDVNANTTSRTYNWLGKVNILWLLIFYRQKKTSRI